MIPLSDFMSAVAFAQDGSLLPNSELHGDRHWRAVASQGLYLAELRNLGERGRVTAALFGLFHDCRRENDGDDPEHGLRGGQAFTEAPSLTGLRDWLPGWFSETLVQSCVLHDKGHVTEDLLLGLGWDADRSVLGRCGIKPSFGYFSCIPQQEFRAFVEEGRSVTDAPPSWEDIWHRAFAAR